MIEAETIDSLPSLRGEMEIPFTIRCRGMQHGFAIVGTVRYGHVWDWVPGRIKDKAFDSLSKLGLIDNYELSNRLCRSDEECAHKRDHDQPTHEAIISQLNS
jgi:hypothetical protein